MVLDERISLKNSIWVVTMFTLFNNLPVEAYLHWTFPTLGFMLYTTYGFIHGKLRGTKLKVEYLVLRNYIQSG